MKISFVEQVYSFGHNNYISQTQRADDIVIVCKLEAPQDTPLNELLETAHTSDNAQFQFYRTEYGTIGEEMVLEEGSSVDYKRNGPMGTSPGKLIEVLDYLTNGTFYTHVNTAGIALQEDSRDAKVLTRTLISRYGDHVSKHDLFQSVLRNRFD